MHPLDHHQWQPLVRKITVIALQGVPSGRVSGVTYTVAGLLASHDCCFSFAHGVLAGALTRWWILAGFVLFPMSVSDTFLLSGITSFAGKVLTSLPEQTAPLDIEDFQIPLIQQLAQTILQAL